MRVRAPLQRANWVCVGNVFHSWLNLLIYDFLSDYTLWNNSRFCSISNETFHKWILFIQVNRTFKVVSIRREFFLRFILWQGSGIQLASCVTPRFICLTSLSTENCELIKFHSKNKKFLLTFLIKHFLMIFN